MSVVVQQQQPQASVGSKREGATMGGNNDGKSFSSSSVDSDSSSEDESSLASQSYEGGHDQMVEEEVYDKGEDININSLTPMDVSLYGPIAKILATEGLNTKVYLRRHLIMELVMLTDQTNKTWRKLRFSAFQQCMDLGVADRVFISKSSSACSR